MTQTSKKRAREWVMLFFILIFLMFLTKDIRATDYECDTAALCNSRIISAADGDVVRMNSSIDYNQNGTAINISNVGNITFDCNGSDLVGPNNGNTSNYGIRVESSNNISIYNCNISGFNYGFYSSSSSMLDIQNFSTTKVAYGIRDSSGNNNFYKNIIITNTTYRGFGLFSTNNSFIDNTSITNNATSSDFEKMGFYIYYGYNNSLINSVSTQASLAVDLSTNFNTTLSNLTLVSSPIGGISLSLDGNDSLENIIIRDSLWGLYLNGDFNILDNITLDSNQNYGINFIQANYNVFKNSEILNTTQYGLWFSSSNDNFLYNNFFNNTVNYYNSTSGLVNYFNTTQTLNTNIIGGPYTGGNYWANPSGTGFSETCTDSDGDYVCDLPYSPDGANYDYLPLSSEPSSILFSFNFLYPSLFSSNLTQTFSANITSIFGNLSSATLYVWNSLGNRILPVVGNMWTANYGNDSVTKISPTGSMTTYPGTGTSPYAIAFDGTNMWTANFDDNSVTKISPTGSMTTYPGTGTSPYAIAFDGTNMWTANEGDNSVTKISPTGSMTTYSGTGQMPQGIAFDGTNMWTSNYWDDSVTKISPTGSMTTYSGTGTSPRAIAFDGTNMWTANFDDNSVTKISPTGSMTTYPGTGTAPNGIAFDGTNMWTANSYGSVTKIFPNGTMITYPGISIGPYAIVFDGVNMWVANGGGYRSVTKIFPNGTMITYAATGDGAGSIAFDGIVLKDMPYVMRQISGVSNQTNWTYTLPSTGKYYWNVKTCDDEGNCSFASQNRTLNIDAQCGTVSECNAAIANAGPGAVIYLNTSISGATGYAINITNTQNVTFDCQGNWVNGTRVSNSMGIWVNGSKDITVKNCKVSSFYYGIESDYSNNTLFDSSTAFNNFPIGIVFYNSNYSTVMNSSGFYNTSSGITIYYGYDNKIINSFGSKCSGHAGSVVGTVNTTIINSTFSDTYTGFDVGLYSNNTLIINSTFRNNSNAGVREGPDPGYNTTIINSTFENNAWTGIQKAAVYIDFTNSSVISSRLVNNSYGLYILGTGFLAENLTILNSSVYGVYFKSNGTYRNVLSSGSFEGFNCNQGSYNVFDNVTSVNNSEFGFSFDFLSKNNTINNSLINSNGISGIVFYSLSGNNTVVNSVISNNSFSGLNITNSNNTFYNNIFNNTVNYYNGSSGIVTYFNTTLIAGTNIVGGPYIGGNYWDNWSAPGTLFSETCTDADRNGICDSPYTFIGGVDYLPLTDYVPPVTYECDSVEICNSAILGANYGDTVKMNQSITYDQNGTAIDFQGKDGITFDCQGFSLTGPNIVSTSNFGFYFTSGSDGDTLRNCKVSNFYGDVAVNTASNGIITNVTATNGNRGFTITSANNFTLRYNNMSNNIYNFRFGGTTSSNPQNIDPSNLVEEKSVYFNTSISDYIFDSTTAPNAGMIVCGYCTNVTYKDMVLSPNNYYGVYLSYTNYSKVENVTANNSYDGIKFNYGGNNTLINSNIHSNSYEGLTIFYSSGNYFYGNNISNNTDNFHLSAGSSFIDNNQTIDVSNLIEGKNVYYNVSISDYIFDSTTAPNAGMVVCSSCNNVTYKDLNLGVRSYAGLYFYNTTNSTIENITSNENYYYGIYLSSYSSNSTVRNVVANNNTVGLNVFGDNSSVTNSIFNNNSAYGILISSNNGTYDNVTVSYSPIGINIGYGLLNNSLYNSYIFLNTYSGIFSVSNYSLIYNNVLNNTINYDIGTLGIISYFNTTLTAGTNIMGGPHMGGNYWGAPDGMGFSDNCTDANRDGICDSNYTLNFDMGVDYLPLANPPVPGTFECGSISSCNNLIQNSLSGDTVQMNASMNYNQNGTAINLTNIQNITFDCNGFNLTGLGDVNNTNYGIYLTGTNNTVLKNCNVSNFYDGFYFVYSYNNTLEDSIINSSYDGILISVSYNNTLKNNKIRNCSDSGILVYVSSDNLLINNSLSYNDYGVYFSSSSNNTLTDSILNNNNDGILLSSGSGNNVTNVTSIDNSYGVYVSSSSNNTIRDSVVSNNSNFGIYLLVSNYNLFYNNLFNNTVNYHNVTSGMINYFNTTLTTGTNIMEGSQIGGNYWAFPNGTGSSDLCSGLNGLCVSQYNLSDGNNFDYLPLTYNSLSSISNTLPNILENQTTMVNLSNSILNSTMDLIHLDILPKHNITNATVVVHRVNETSPSARVVISGKNLTSGKAYQAFQINSYGFNDSDLNNVTIFFKVNTSWITANGLDANNITLYRNSGDGNWTALPTAVNGSDSDYYYFYAVSPGFSYYVIFVNNPYVPPSVNPASPSGGAGGGAGGGIASNSTNETCTDGQKICTDGNVQICVLGTYTDFETCEFGCDNGVCLTEKSIPSSSDSPNQAYDSSSIVGGLFNFFNSITPAFFKQTTLGYVIYYFLLVLVVSGIVIVSFTLYKRTIGLKSKDILKEANRKKKR